MEVCVHYSEEFEGKFITTAILIFKENNLENERTFTQKSLEIVLFAFREFPLDELQFFRGSFLYVII